MYLRLLFAALAVVFAYLQLNDPDPWLWVFLYLATAGMLIWSALGLPPKVVYKLGLAIILIGMLFLLPDFLHWIKLGMPTIATSMKAVAPHIELAREFLGLALCGICWYWLLESED